MAAFEQHVNIAVIASGVILVPLYSSLLIDMHQTLGLLTLGILGGILPDLDSENSRPIQISFRMLSIFLPFMVLLTLQGELSILKILISWGVLAFILNFVVFKTFVSITSHRGIFHSIPMGLAMAYLLFVFFHQVIHLSYFFSTLSAFFLFFGFLVHLVLDEIFSINALGLHIKKSFGTALKLYDKNNIFGSLTLYVAIAFMYYFYPFDTHIFSEIFNSVKHLKL